MSNEQYPQPSAAGPGLRRRRRGAGAGAAREQRRRMASRRRCAAATRAGFITDVLVELGYVTAEQVGAGDRGGAHRRPPAGGAAARAGRDQRRPALARDRRALRPRPRRPHRLPGRHGGRQPVPGQRRRAATARSRSATSTSETLLVAMADPANVLAVDDIQMATGLDCRVAVAAEDDIEALIARLNTLQSAVTEAVDRGGGRGDEEEASQRSPTCRHRAEDAPVIKLVYSILGQAVGEGASDIHFEPERGRDAGPLPGRRRAPRGRPRAEADGRRRDLAHQDHERARHRREAGPPGRPRQRQRRGPPGRPARHHAADPARRGGDDPHPRQSRTRCCTLDELGMDGDARERFEASSARPTARSWSPARPARASRRRSTRRCRSSTTSRRTSSRSRTRSSTGSTGSTRSTSTARPGLDFATGLRSILRADPDIIMVGEIRDAETARIAIEAALTGHMVLTTLHTNDAPGAVTRLAKMGIESFLTASAVDCVVAQRLARKLCTALQAAQTVISGERSGRGRLPGRRRPRGLRAGRLRPLQPDRLPRPARPLLGDGDERADQGHGGRRARPRPRSPHVARAGGNADPARGRPCQGPRRADQHRGGGQGRDLMPRAQVGRGLRRCRPRNHGFRLRRSAQRDGRGAGLRRPPDAGLPAGDARARAGSRRWRATRSLTPQQTREVVYSILNDDQRKRFENNKQLDFAYAIPGVARFRVNCFFQRGAVSAAFRLLPHEIPDLDSLGAARRCCASSPSKPRGFVLVTGPTGSGQDARPWRR